jgi:hypothetical protein
MGYKTLLSGGFAAICLLGAASSAGAEPALNRCWGEIRSQLNQLETPEGTKGGAGGQHSRSTQAADKNGGFAHSGNDFRITFNVGVDADKDGKIDPGTKGRTGVGNVSDGPPHSDPNTKDRGNSYIGQHAINNGNDASGLGFANILDPVSGEFLPRDENGNVITNGTLDCSLVP